MRKQFVLFVGILMLIKPFWPVAEYAINYDYIVENLCENRDKPLLNCDGKCYLAKQLAKESEGSEENPFEANPSKLEIQFITSFESVFNFGLENYNDTVQDNFKSTQNLFSREFLTDIAKPPEGV
ncbi:hypothetical protein HCG49_10810 [Arenibacter sp. 6A1]|uniref:hypothetical protein n=1 Tax=Arenibacter sp. 6A1 TaxID=2720391 RepID=UPI001447E65C|nr:hypothetical protein [Arenibacter sp. 6A1]NKI27053.1 hypothetical protein [Arenibacter sp. 6A1]